MTRYRALANRLKEAIQNQQLSAGQRLPSIRSFADQQAVSITTALNCYHYLEEHGYIKAKAQSGYYVCGTSKNLDKPDTPAFKPQAVTGNNAKLIHAISLAEQDPNHIPLGSASLADELAPKNLINRSLIRATRGNLARSCAYSHPYGEPPLREAISRLGKNYGLHYSQNDILVTNGAMEAISLAIRATTNAGDCVAIPSPCYSGFLRLLECLNRTILELPTSPNSEIDTQWFAKLLTQQNVKAVIFTSVNQNPIGFTLNSKQKQSLAKLAQVLDIPFIEDDVFGDCSFSNNDRSPAKVFDRSGNIIYCNSISKTLAPGYRLGWCIPGKYQTRLQQEKIANSIGNSTPLQLALADFIFCGQYEKHLKNLNTVIHKNIHLMTQAIEQHFPEGIKITQPDGLYTLWLELPENIDGLKIYHQALEKKICIMPGCVFTSSNRYQNFIRVNAGVFWNDKIQKAIETLGSIVYQSLSTKQ